MKLHLVHVALAATLAAAEGPAQSAVTTLPPNAFQIAQQRSVAAGPERLQPALSAVASWWNVKHTFSGNAANLNLEPRAGGCFCERWDQGSVQHLQVVMAEPGIVRLAGAMGPLQGLAVQGVMTISIEAKDGKNTLSVVYRVGGVDAASMEKWPAAVDAMIGETTDRLAAYLNDGAH